MILGVARVGLVAVYCNLMFCCDGVALGCLVLGCRFIWLCWFAEVGLCGGLGFCVIGLFWCLLVILAFSGWFGCLFGGWRLVFNGGFIVFYVSLWFGV